MAKCTRFVLSLLICFSGAFFQGNNATTEPQKESHMVTSDHNQCNVDKKNPINTDPEHKLMKHLMENYNKNARPVLNKTKAVNITFGIAFNQIIELDSRKQALRSKVWLRQFWNNPYLTWNESDYCNMKSIVINSKYIWKPDVVLYNSIGQDAAVYNRDYFIKIHSTGYTEWYCPAEISSICKINIKDFPFDSQECTLKFGSWAYTGVEVNLLLKNPTADLTMFTENGEWEVLTMSGKRNTVTYACCSVPYIDITYTLKIKRRVMYYVNNLIIPCVVLATLTVLSFYLPPESGERVSLVVTVLLGLTVFMLLYNESIPPTSEAMPLIGKYFIVVLIEVTSSLFATCVIIRCYHHNPFKEMPRWFRYLIFSILAPVFRMRFPMRTLKIQERRQPSAGARIVQHNKHLYAAMPNGTPKFKQWNGNSHVPSPQGSRTSLDKMPLENDEKVDTISQQMDILLDYFDNEQSIDVKRDEWHFASIVLDQVFFWLFTSTIILSVICFYAKIP